MIIGGTPISGNHHIVIIWFRYFPIESISFLPLLICMINHRQPYIDQSQPADFMAKQRLSTWGWERSVKVKSFDLFLSHTWLTNGRPGLRDHATGTNWLEVATIHIYIYIYVCTCFSHRPFVTKSRGENCKFLRWFKQRNPDLWSSHILRAPLLYRRPGRLSQCQYPLCCTDHGQSQRIVGPEIDSWPEDTPSRSLWPIGQTPIAPSPHLWEDLESSGGPQSLAPSAEGWGKEGSLASSRPRPAILGWRWGAGTPEASIARPWWGASRLRRNPPQRVLWDVQWPRIHQKLRGEQEHQWRNIGECSLWSPDPIPSGSKRRVPRVQCEVPCVWGLEAGLHEL